MFFLLKVLPVLPKEEKYHLGGQIREALVRVTANIAEGYGRFHHKEGIQFYMSLYPIAPMLLKFLIVAVRNEYETEHLK